MFCSQCGHNLGAGARFCSACGAPITGITNKHPALRDLQEVLRDWDAMKSFLMLAKSDQLVLEQLWDNVRRGITPRDDALDAVTAARNELWSEHRQLMAELERLRNIAGAILTSPGSREEKQVAVEETLAPGDGIMRKAQEVSAQSRCVGVLVGELLFSGRCDEYPNDLRSVNDRNVGEVESLRRLLP